MRNHTVNRHWLVSVVEDNRAHRAFCALRRVLLLPAGLRRLPETMSDAYLNVPTAARHFVTK